MSIISASTTLTTALQYTADTTGTLVFKTGATPTTALTLNADQSATFAGTVNFATAAFTNLSYTGTLTGGTGVVNLGSGQFYKDASGNVGIGIASPSQKLEVFGNQTTPVSIKIRNDNGATTGGTKLVFGNYAGTDVAYLNSVSDGSVFNANLWNSSGYLAFGAANQERMRITADGNLLLGTSVAAQKFTIGVNTANGDGISLSNFNTGSYSTLQVNGATGYGVSGWANSIVFEGVPASTGNTVFSSYSNSIVFQTGARTERMRIDSSGNVLVGTGPTITGSKLTVIGNAGIAVQGSSGTNGGNVTFNSVGGSSIYHQIASDVNTFYIANGAFTSYAYLTPQSFSSWAFASDKRIKENIVDLDYGLDAVMQIKPRRFDYIRNKQNDIGFIAQELKTVIPEAVQGEEVAFDEADTPQERANKTLGITKDSLIPVLVKAIQELKAEFDEYKATHP